MDMKPCAKFAQQTRHALRRAGAAQVCAGAQKRHANPPTAPLGELMHYATRRQRITENWEKHRRFATQKRQPLAHSNQKKNAEIATES
tara:strand:+ start:1462 stop:1725 length:264 start_codon:yes stop_codon:yes gene_type:complete